MEDKSLADKAVSIKGKQYVLVQDRVLYFFEHFQGSIMTDLLTPPESKLIVVKATVTVYKDWTHEEGEYDTPLVFTGHSQAIVGDGMVNKTAALENAETSAVGRALAFMGIGVIESIASADEMRKATMPQNASKQPYSMSPEQKVKADKDRVLSLLKMLKLPCATKEECEASVLANTSLPLIPSKLEEIASRLALIIEENKTK